MAKRGGALSGLISKRAKLNEQTSSKSASSGGGGPRNPFLTRPVKPEDAIRIFLFQSRAEAKRRQQHGSNKPVVEIEARIGILKSPYGAHEMRVSSSGPKRINNKVANAFLCNGENSSQRANFEGGITRSHYVHWTMAGLSEASSVSSAFGVRPKPGENEAAVIKRDLRETDLLETVYGGFSGDHRIIFPGDYNPQQNQQVRGHLEQKEKLSTMDIALPSAPYDLRLTLATEKAMDKEIREPPKGWKTRRLKRRRSYRRGTFAWQLDITEVTTVSSGSSSSTSIGYEIEMELCQDAALKLLNEPDETKAQKMCQDFSNQLWWMLSQINPMSDVLDAEEFLREHPDRNAVQLALCQCGVLKRYMDQGGGAANASYQSVIQPNGSSALPNNSASLSNLKFMGCMPVNFQRHNIEDVQRSEDNGYFLSEKTDGLRFLMIFTGKTAVLVDRAMKGMQPTPRPGASDPNADPLAPLIPLIKPGTVFDGEVVMHRKLRRPIFIVFDVLSISATEPILHLPFEQRYQHLRRASFRTPTADRDMFAPNAVMDPSIALPLVRKNFVRRTDLDDLLSHVVEERGVRTYRHEKTHFHATDGIIFQPNLPYKCGTDMNLLKWKYLDTVTIDVEIMPPQANFRGQNRDEDEDVLRVGVLGEDQTMVDMTRFIKLPPSERRRLEADRHENGAKIAEVGFDPTTGEWYYLTMRPEKIAPNHISTVLGTLLELAESLSTEELRFRMSVPAGKKDSYRKDIRGMQRQLLEHQRRRLRDGR